MSSDNSNKYLDALIECLDELSSEDETDKVDKSKEPESEINRNTSDKVQPADDVADPNVSVSQTVAASDSVQDSGNLSQQDTREIERDRQVDAQDDEQAVEDVPRGGRGREEVRRPPASPHRINSQTAKYLTSSSAKRKQIKEENCNFCPAICTKENFEDHLLNKESCKHLYLRKHHLKTVEAVLVTCFKCLYCDSDFRQLNNHLKHSPNCLSKYQERFGVESVNEVTKKVTALKGQAWKSKRSLSRAIESAKAKDNKRLKAQNEPLETNLNQHIQQTSFSNYKKCGNCKSNLMNAKEVLENDKCFSDAGFYNFEDFSPHRRTEKYFLCSYCEKSKMEIPDFSSSKFIMLPNETDTKVLFYPVLKTNNEEELEDQDLQFGHGKSVKILLPKSFESLETFPSNIPLKSLSEFELQIILYGDKAITRETLALVYEHQLSKYLRRKRFGELYHGKVIDEDSKLLSSVKLCSSENQIRGSESWKQTQNYDVQWKMMQLGKCSTFIEVDVPVKIGTVATTMLQDNLVLTVKYEGSATQEMSRKYYVHRGECFISDFKTINPIREAFIILYIHNLDHDSTVNCSVGNCEEIEISQFIQDHPEYEESVTNRNITTFVSSTEQFVHSFIHQIIKCPASAFESSEYHFQVHCVSDDLFKMRGIIWPLKIQRMNLINVDRTLSEEDILDIRNEYLQFVDNSVCASSKLDVLEAQFNLTEAESLKVSRMAEDYQTHLCLELDCQICKDCSMPSLETSFTVAPPANCLENIATSERFVKLMRIKLLNLTTEEIKSWSTSHWIENMFLHIDRSELQPSNLWNVEIFGQAFIFKVDSRLSDLIVKYEACPLKAVYQYSITCSSHSEQCRIVLKRRYLLDSFTLPFYPFYLKAADAKVAVQMINSNSEWNEFNRDPIIQDISNIEGIVEHKEMTLSEALVEAEGTKLRVNASSKIEFVNTRSDIQSIFKKAKEESEFCYKVEGDDSTMYELQETYVTRFFKSLNSQDLLLCEYVVHYDFVGSEKSKNLFDVFAQKLDKIEQSDTKSVLGDANLPEMIICSNGQVMKKRRKPKILKFPDYEEDTYDFKYNLVLLFCKVASLDDLSPETVDVSFNETDDGGERIIFKHRRYLLNFFHDQIFIN